MLKSLFDNLCFLLNRDKLYDLDFKNPNSDKSLWLPYEKLTDLYQEFIKEFPVVSIEDPFDQDHWEAWSNITANTSIQVELHVNHNTRNLFCC